MTDQRRRTRLRIVVILAIVVLVVLAAAWRWTPLHDYANPRIVGRWLLTLAHTSWMPVVVIAVYVLSNAVMFPNTVLCFATIIALGTHPGLLYATVGSLLAALAAYAFGRRFGADTIKGLELKSVNRMSRALRQGGVVQITILRLLPLAPFSIVNLMAGAAKVRVVPFTVGTFLGLLPGNLLFTAFGRQLRQMIAHPTPWEVTAFAAVTVLGSVAFWYLHRLTMAQASGRRDG